MYRYVLCNNLNGIECNDLLLVIRCINFFLLFFWVVNLIFEIVRLLVWLKNCNLLWIFFRFCCIFSLMVILKMLVYWFNVEFDWFSCLIIYWIFYLLIIICFLFFCWKSSIGVWIEGSMVCWSEIWNFELKFL